MTQTGKKIQLECQKKFACLEREGTLLCSLGHVTENAKLKLEQGHPDKT